MKRLGRQQSRQKDWFGRGQSGRRAHHGVFGCQKEGDISGAVRKGGENETTEQAVSTTHSLSSLGRI